MNQNIHIQNSLPFALRSETKIRLHMHTQAHADTDKHIHVHGRAYTPRESESTDRSTPKAASQNPKMN